METVGDVGGEVEEGAAPRNVGEDASLVSSSKVLLTFTKPEQECTMFSSKSFCEDPLPGPLPPVKRSWSMDDGIFPGKYLFRNPRPLPSSSILSPRFPLPIETAPIVDASESYIAVGASSSRGDDETFLCPICLENEPVRDRSSLPCGHDICFVCIVTYLTTRIQDGVTDITCPFLIDDSQTCGREIPQETIVELLGTNSNEQWLKKYNKFSQLKNENLRECPRCCTLNEGSLASPSIRCRACEDVYCYSHSLAHDVSETCAQYERRMKAKELSTRKFIKETCKKCPSCKRMVYKFEGCNHITCRCTAEWCWLCGANLKIHGVNTHYRTILSACVGRQYSSGLESSLLRIYFFAISSVLLSPLVISLALIFVVCNVIIGIGIILWILISICCVRARVRASRLSFKRILTPFAVLIAVVLFALAAVYTTVLLILSPLLLMLKGKGTFSNIVLLPHILAWNMVVATF